MSRWAADELRSYLEQRIDRRGPTECWPWLLSVGSHGYGQCWDGENVTVAHRLAYEMLVGPIPEGLVIDHLCGNRPCCNPAHMEPVTQGENGRRGSLGTKKPGSGWRRNLTHCRHGHPYDEANTYIYPQSGHRACRACMRAKQQARL